MKSFNDYVVEKRKLVESGFVDTRSLDDEEDGREDWRQAKDTRRSFTSRDVSMLFSNLQKVWQELTPEEKQMFQQLLQK